MLGIPSMGGASNADAKSSAESSSAAVMGPAPSSGSLKPAPRVSAHSDSCTRLQPAKFTRADLLSRRGMLHCTGRLLTAWARRCGGTLGTLANSTHARPHPPHASAERHPARVWLAQHRA